MHVLVVASWYKTPEAPTSGSFFEDQARMLHRYGHRVAVLHPDWSGSFRKGLRRGFRTPTHDFDDAGIPTTRLVVDPVLPGDHALNRRRLERSVRALAAPYSERLGIPDVVHAHSALYGGFAGHVLCRLWRRPLVLTEHASQLVVDQRLTTASKALVETVATAAASVACVSSSQRAAMARSYRGFERAAIVGNVVAEAFLDRPLQPAPTGEFVWVVVGGLTPLKRPRLALEAFALFATRVPSGRLVYVGDGPLRRELEALAVARGVGGRVAFAGSASREAVRAHLASAHALLSASAFETFGLSIAEAIAMGRPVAVTRSGGPEDFVDGRSGILSADDPDALAGSMAELYQRYGKYDPGAMRAIIRDRFSAEAIHEQTMRLYRPESPA